MNPVFLAGLIVEGRRCVVFGGDREAHAKARALAEVGGVVEIVSLEVIDDIAALAREGRVRLVAEEPRIEHANGAFLVMSAVRNEAFGEALFRRASEPGGFLLCCIDQPPYFTFTNVATVRRGPVQIGIATNGTAPMLAARMRESLEDGLDEEFTRFAERLAALRAETEPAKRREVIAKALEGFAMELRVSLPRER